MVLIDPFVDIVGRHFRQPKEGLGNDGSTVAHDRDSRRATLDAGGREQASLTVCEWLLVAGSRRPEKTGTQNMGSLQRGLIYWLAEALIGDP